MEDTRLHKVKDRGNVVRYLITESGKVGLVVEAKQADETKMLIYVKENTNNDKIKSHWCLAHTRTKASAKARG